MTLPPPPEPLPTPVVDTHCHLDIVAGDDWLPVDEALEQASAVGVTRIVQIGCDVDSARWSVRTAAAYDRVRAGIALHPNEAPRIYAEGRHVALGDAYAAIEDLAVLPEVAAIGETGLDHYRTGEDGREVQEESFRWHIRLARRLGKPLVIHDRDAHEDVIRVLEDEGPPQTVVFHCFSGDVRMAEHCADRGWYLSFAGTVTFKNAEPLREALRVVPQDRVLVETDAPYLTPVPYRGRTNASYLVPLTVRSMAETRGEPVESLSSALWDNSLRVFGSW